MSPRKEWVPIQALEFLRKMGKKGGRNRAKALSPTRRKEISSAGGTSRWQGLSVEQRKRVMNKVRAQRTYQTKKPK
jgi:general stress protein YciG